MADKITEKELIELKDAFSIFDKNNDGFIKKSNVREILISLGKVGSDEQVNRVIKEVDADGDGVISFPEFVSLMTAKDYTDSAMESASELEQMFRIFDRDNDGYITLMEMKNALDEMSSEPVPFSEVEEMIKEADHNGDQKVSYKEFKAIMKVKYPDQYK